MHRNTSTWWQQIVAERPAVNKDKNNLNNMHEFLMYCIKWEMGKTPRTRRYIMWGVTHQFVTKGLKFYASRGRSGTPLVKEMTQLRTKKGNIWYSTNAFMIQPNVREPCSLFLGTEKVTTIGSRRRDSPVSLCGIRRLRGNKLWTSQNTTWPTLHGWHCRPL